MAITITTQYTFTTDDGTVYSDTIAETIDEDGDASLPMRYRFEAGITKEHVLDFSTVPAFGQAVAGQYNTIFAVNRSDSDSVTLDVQDSTGDRYFVALGPGEWHYMPLSQMVAGTGATEPLNNIAKISMTFEKSAGAVEMLVFTNPGS